MEIVEERYSFNWVYLSLLAHDFKPPAGFPYPSFPLVNSPEDMAALIELTIQSRESKDSRKALKQLVERKGRQAETRLKKWLRLRRGRPRDISRRERWTRAAKLRQQDPKKYSWGVLARLDPAYEKDPRGAADRMRHGVEAVRKHRRGKSKSA